MMSGTEASSARMPNHLNRRPNSRNWIVSDAAARRNRCRQRSACVISVAERPRDDACCSRYKNVDTQVMTARTRDAEQVRRAHHLYECGEHAAAHGPVRALCTDGYPATALWLRRVRGLPALPADDQRHEQQRQEQQRRRRAAEDDGTDRTARLRSMSGPISRRCCAPAQMKPTCVPPAHG